MREILDEAFALLSEDIALAHAKDLDRDGQAGHLAGGNRVARLRPISRSAKRKPL